jgi:hypothetical protein
MANEFVIRKGFHSKGDSHITGSLIVTNQFTSSGINYPTADGSDRQLFSTDGAGSISLNWADRVNVNVKNTSGTTLQIGTPVYITSFQGSSLYLVSAASASNESTMPASMVLAETLVDNAQGVATTLGALKGINTIGYQTGSSLYVASNGGLTDVQPTGSDLIQKIANVGNVASNGEITVLGAGRTNATPNLLTGDVFYGVNNSAVNKPMVDILSGSVKTNQLHLEPYGGINPNIHFSGSVYNSIYLAVEDSGSLTFAGDNGGLFSIDDSKDGILSATSDVSGNPILLVDSNWNVYAGSPFTEPWLVSSGSYVTKNVYNISSPTATQSIDLQQGYYHYMSCSVDTQLSFSNPPINNRYFEFQLELYKDNTVTQRNLDYTNTVLWPSGVGLTELTASSEISIAKFQTRDGGTTWFGTVIGRDFI